jgi:glucose/mannose-6-phosphate isomerase
MNYREAILSFPNQLQYQPEIQNKQNFGRFNKFIVAGMGGSALAAGLIKSWKPAVKLIINRDYGIPAFVANELENLFIASSYSGDTEEVIDAYNKAGENGIRRAAISTGGELLKMAKKDGIPFIKIPDTGIQARAALGFSVKALLKLMGEEKALEEVSTLSVKIKPEELEKRAMMLAHELGGRVPVIYASSRNLALAYNWKIRFNENTKIPAFSNVFPELNHNEIAGFTGREAVRSLTGRFYFIILKDPDDHPRILRRVEIMKDLYKKQGLFLKIVDLEGGGFYKIFSAIVLADWTSYHLALYYGVNPDKTPIIDEFKRLI